MLKRLIDAYICIFSLPLHSWPTMPCCLWGTATMKSQAPSTGRLRTLGVKTGVKEVTSGSSEAMTSVLSSPWLWRLCPFLEMCSCSIRTAVLRWPVVWLCLLMCWAFFRVRFLHTYDIIAPTLHLCIGRLMYLRCCILFMVSFLILSNISQLLLTPLSSWVIGAALS